MPSLEIAKRTIAEILSDRTADFLIPDYQRPYSWQHDECETLWNDLFEFAFPGNNKDSFSRADTYFLGPIVTYKSENGKQEIIDGQQRLTTLLLLLRAFFTRFGRMQDLDSIRLRESIGKLIWKTGELETTDFDSLKIDSEVATDSDKAEFLSILRTGEAPASMKSKYAHNYRYFQDNIERFLLDYAGYFPYFPARIMNNCVLLPIESDSQDMALRIFSTLNDRGLPLSDADIFKAQFYKYFSSVGKRDLFIAEWKQLEEVTEDIFHPTSGTPMDELFTRYMYYERAKAGNISSTTEGLRKFYEKNGYALLKNETTFWNLKILADFWRDVSRLETSRFSPAVLRRLFTLEYAPNGMWANLASVYFMKNKDETGHLPDEDFTRFLDVTIAFTYANSFIHPGLSALRTPVFSEMAEILKGNAISFKNAKFDETGVRNAFNGFQFTNNRPITKSILVWWAFQANGQGDFTEKEFDIEHIYARKRAELEPLSKKESLESLGNKAILEKRINIRASDYRFADKKKFYLGETPSRKKGTDNQELIALALTKTDFTESDIQNRTGAILNRFIQFLSENNLLQ